MSTPTLYEEAVQLLRDLIRIPSPSKQEDQTATLLESRMIEFGLQPERDCNNVWIKSSGFNLAKPTLLLNSHHDTVKPNQQWSTDPFDPRILGDKLSGLGSNDAGASVVCLLSAFRHFNSQNNLPFNIIFAATAEEEISGTGGIESVYSKFGSIDYAIVGEPTNMEVAVAEKGLLVLDCIARGKAGHAARNEGQNAILKAMKDIEWFTDYSFEKNSPWLGKVKMSVTVINGGTQHNVVPETCHFTVDIRLTEEYSHDEILETIRNNVSSEVTPRSTRIRPSGIPTTHELFRTAKSLNKIMYGSPTTSDQALIPAPSVKMGPGDSARSHTADEYILFSEIREGIDGYIEYINTLAQIITTNSNTDNQ